MVSCRLTNSVLRPYPCILQDQLELERIRFLTEQMRIMHERDRELKAKADELRLREAELQQLARDLDARAAAAARVEAAKGATVGAHSEAALRTAAPRAAAEAEAASAPPGMRGSNAAHA